MKNYLIKIIYIFLNLLHKIINKIFKKNNFLQHVHDKIENHQYVYKIINNKKINFFCPSAKTLERVNTLFTKEPETLMWIDKFENNQKKIIFWDIGANIGLYSLYAGAKHNNIEVVAFEPGTSNLRVLSRNISINSFSDRIKIFPIALNDEENIFKNFEEINFGEGRGRANFNSNIDQHGNSIPQNKIQNKYTLFGTTIDNLIDNKSLKIPNFIKIDVDGIELKILYGSRKLLSNNELKEIQIELNPAFEKNYEAINKFLSDNGFKKISETNEYLLKNKDYILTEKNILNAVYRKVV